MNDNEALNKPFMEEIKKIVDDKSLREFLLEKNKWRQADKNNCLTAQDKMDLRIQVYKNIFSQNKKLSVETCVELSKLLSKSCSRFNFDRLKRGFKSYLKSDSDQVLQALSADFEIYKHLSIYNTQTKKIENMEEIFAFIKKHKDTNNTPKDIKDYLGLILYVLKLDCFDSANCHVADFLALKLVDFSNPTSYDELFFYDLYNLLLLYLAKDKNNQQATIETLKNILNNTPGTILGPSCTMGILEAFRENHVNFSMDSVMINKLFSEYNFEESVDDLITILIYCENNSLSGEIMDKMLDGLCEYRKRFGKHISDQVWATPSLINFIKQKLNSNHNYPLEQKLKEKFQNDICNADNVDFCLNKFFVRCCFEVSARIPHRKHDVVEMLKGYLRHEINYVYRLSKKVKVKDQLMFLCRECCGYGITNKYEKAGIFDETYREFDGFVKTIFEEKGLIATEINKNNQPNGCLTIQEIRAIVLSNFKFGDYGVTKEKFQSVIMDKIDDVDHFEWLLQVHIEQDAPIEASDLCCYVKHLKIDSLWLLDKCLSIIQINVNGISETVLNALLDVYDGSEPLIFDKEHDPYRTHKNNFDCIKKLVYKFKDQSLINKFEGKFKPAIENIDEPHVEMGEGVEQEVEIPAPPADTENNLQNHQMDIRDKNKSENENENEEKKNGFKMENEKEKEKEKEKEDENRNREEPKNREGYQGEEINSQIANKEEILNANGRKEFENKEDETQKQKDVNPEIQKDTNPEESKTPIWLVILEKIAYCFWFVFTLGSPIWAPSLTEKLFPGPKILKSDQNKNKVDKSILPDTSEDKSKDKKDKNIKLENDNKNRDVK